MASPLVEQLLQRIEELEKRNIYSKEEVEIGKWVDGEPLYRQVFISDTKNFNAGTHKIGDLSSSYRVRRMECLFTNTNSNGDYLIGNNNSNLVHTNNVINIEFSSPWGIGYLECIIYYTK